RRRRHRRAASRVRRRASHGSRSRRGVDGGDLRLVSMTAQALTGIGQLVTCDGEQGRGALGIVERAALVVDGDLVVYAGPAAGAPDADLRLDLEGRCVLPGFVDSHTHLIFSG